MKNRTYQGKINKLNENQIFIYGANTQFRHGKGSALKALDFGAVYGKGGLQGQTYAIITKDLTVRKHPSISKDFIVSQILELYKYAEDHPELEFIVPYNTSPNLNAYSSKEMASMFSCTDIPENIIFEEGFSKLL